ncbi:MAG: TIGR03905 family TSCPD domain-containing protein [Bacillota bacterium]|nr:TIGR03905 family TSCPD domain-containing protein [Bacillota bacterium]
MKKNLKYLIVLLCLSLVFVGCNKKTANVAQGEEATIKEENKDYQEKSSDTRVYEGLGQGRNGEIKVAVSLDADKKIVDLQLLDHEESDGFWEKALEGMKEQMVEKQSLAIEAVSGATLTSNGIMEGAAQALEGAELNLEDLGYIPPALPDPSEQIVETGANKVGIRNFEYTTQGNTCSTKITFNIKEEDMTVYDLIVYNGCDGNARGFSALADGSNVDDIIQRFEGVTCHSSDGSSCPDQVAKALNEARYLIQGERLLVKN